MLFREGTSGHLRFDSFFDSMVRNTVQIWLAIFATAMSSKLKTWAGIGSWKPMDSCKDHHRSGHARISFEALFHGTLSNSMCDVPDMQADMM